MKNSEKTAKNTDFIICPVINNYIESHRKELSIENNRRYSIEEAVYDLCNNKNISLTMRIYCSNLISNSKF